MIVASYTPEAITSASNDAFMLYDRSRFGEKKGRIIEYSAVEALFLIEENKMQVKTSKKELSYKELLEKIKKYDKKIAIKFVVYSNLRKKGYTIKSALKFGADFRVYEKGKSPGEDHARWLVYVTREHEPTNWHEFAAKNRIAHSTKKKLLVAVVDEEKDVSYYECAWLKP